MVYGNLSFTIKKQISFFRNRFVKKPFNYNFRDGGSIFYSELKGIYATALVEIKLNESYLKRYLANATNKCESVAVFENLD